MLRTDRADQALINAAIDGLGDPLAENGSRFLVNDDADGRTVSVFFSFSARLNAPDGVFDNGLR